MKTNRFLKVTLLWVVIPIFLGIIVVPRVNELLTKNPDEPEVRRYGSVIHIRPDKIEEYTRLHADVWPGVLKMISECNIRNYSIFLKDSTLFSYFEYTGTNFGADMDKMAADPVVRQWWDVCKPCQVPLESRKEGEWWAGMEQVFYYN